MTNYLETGVIINKDNGETETYMIPYNINNFLVSEKEIINILNNYSIKIDKINSLKFFHTAFTHKSYVKKEVFTNDILKASKDELNNPQSLLELQNESYERLEYFGDRVVKIVVSMYLFHRYPNEDEGFMTRLQTKIEDKKNLALFSKEIGLGKFFIISKQIESLNGRNLEKIHEDVFEAFMGALFLSNGFEPCCLLITNLLECFVDYSEKLYCDNNYKDNLLRFHHKMKWKFPKYHMIYNEGPAHKRTYIMGVEDPHLSSKYNNKKINEFINNENFKNICTSFGKGSSKKEGEQAAAKMALILHGVLNNDQYKLEDVYYPDWDELDNNNQENTHSENTHSENTHSENTHSENTNSENNQNNSNEISDESDSDYE
jgi:ribonuclease III